MYQTECYPTRLPAGIIALPRLFSNSSNSTEIIKAPYMKQEKTRVATIGMKKYEIRVSIEF